jgi:cytochrome c553
MDASRRMHHLLRAKNNLGGFPVKRVLVWAARILGGLIAIIVIALGVLYVRGGSKTAGGDPVAVRTPAVAVDSALLARGKHIAEAITPCAGCHGNDLGGKPFGTPPILVSMAAPNLTSAGAVKDYTSEDWDRAIRHGVGKDGRRLIIMPSAHYAEMSDADFAALTAYLKSFPPVGTQHPARQVGLLGRALIGAGVFPLAANTIQHTKVGTVQPTPAVTPEYGKYLATLGTCSECHAPDFAGNTSGNGPAGPNLRVLTTAWTLDQFRQTLRTGVNPAGRKLNPELMPWTYFGKMTDDELAAIWAYIGSVAATPLNRK